MGKRALITALLIALILIGVAVYIIIGTVSNGSQSTSTTTPADDQTTTGGDGTTPTPDPSDNPTGETDTVHPNDEDPNESDPSDVVQCWPSCGHRGQCLINHSVGPRPFCSCSFGYKGDTCEEKTTEPQPQPTESITQLAARLGTTVDSLISSNSECCANGISEGCCSFLAYYRQNVPDSKAN